MENTIYFSTLYDLYGELLTDKQRSYFEDYYFNNLTLSEMSENYEVSRNAIHKQIKETCEKLEYYESILSLEKKKRKLENLANQLTEDKLRQELKDII